MAKKIGRPLSALALLVVAGLALAGVRRWQWSHRPDRILAELSAAPAPASQPAVLAERLARATSLVRDPSRTLEGVEQLGRLYHANGFRREAEACWRLLRREQPAEARWAYLLADLRRTDSDYIEFGALLGETVRLAPNYSPAWLQLANFQLKQGQLADAERCYRQRLALVPADPYAQLGLARVALQTSRPDEARRQVEQLLRDAPQFSSGHNLYAEMLASAGDAEGARKQRWLGRETGRFRDADDPWLDGLRDACFAYDRLLVLATMDQQAGRGDRGKSLLERAISLEPENPAAYEALGGLYRSLGDNVAAKEAFETGLRLATAKPDPMYYVKLSETYRQLKQPAEALRVAQQGLTRVGDQLELFDALGVAFADLNRQDEAIAAFRAVLARNPNDSNSNFNLGMSLLVLGRQDEAHAAFERALVQQPTFLKALSLLGRWEMEAGHLDKALTYLQPLYDSHPEIQEARQMLIQWCLRAGAAAEKAGDPAAAEAYYRKGLGVDADQAELQVGLGVLYLTHGRAGDALSPLEAFHRLRPGDPQSALFLGQVYLQTGRLAEARQVLTEGEQLARRLGQDSTAGLFREILNGP